MKSRNFKRIWGRPYDYCFLLNIEQCKMKEMCNYFSKTKRFIGWENVVRNLKICIKLIDIIQEKDSVYQSWLNTSFYNNFNCEFPIHINIKNRKRFLSKDYFEDVSPVVYNTLLADYRAEKALYLYNLIRSYTMRSWYD